MRTVTSSRTGESLPGLDRPPPGYPPALAARLFDAVGRDEWAEWLKVQTRLINEYRLNLAKPEARAFLLEQTEQHFFGGGETAPTGYVPPPPAPTPDPAG